MQKELGGQNKKVEATKTSGDKLVNELLDNPEPVKGSLELMSNRWDEACKASETRQNRLDQALLVRVIVLSIFSHGCNVAIFSQCSYI